MTLRELCCIFCMSLFLAACVVGWLEPEPHAVVDLW